MNIKQYILLMVIVTIISWGAWLAVLFFINPETTAKFGIFLFYLSLFFAVTGTLSLLGFFIRYIFTKHFPEFEQAQIAFRQALFFAIVIVVTLFLQSHHLLTWLNALLLVFLLICIEFLIISLKKS
ncbi:hypothetical protein KKF32_00120 [Patescibacteria group bacterium]|nr:hypothetical protein [Patescibacteria group bacterium]